MPSISVTKLSRVRRKAFNLLAQEKSRDLGELVRFAMEKVWGAEVDALMDKAAYLVAQEQQNEPLVGARD